VTDNVARKIPSPEVDSPSTTLIETRALMRAYHVGEAAVQALRGVSISIDRGEFLAVTGPSGSGKSTFMNILGCLDRPTSGRYLLEGRDVGTLTPEELSQIRNRRIGFVFQSFNLMPRTSVVENVELPLIYGGRSIGAARRRELATRALDRVGLRGHEGSMPSQLSGGEQQRVAIARALVTDPAIILADEPTGNLDSRASDDILALLQGLNREGKTLVMVTHESRIAECAARTVRFRDGCIVEDAPNAPRSADHLPPPGLEHSRAATPKERFLERLPPSLQSLARHRLRSLLTMLGVIIGVGSVVAMLALGAGASGVLQTNITALGTNLIVLYPAVATQSGARVFTGQPNFTPEDVSAIRRECPSVAAVSPLVPSAAQAVAGENNWGTSLVGVDVDWPGIRGWGLSAGSFFGQDDVARAGRVCVLGATVAEALFPGEEAVGRFVRIRNVPFRVEGVFERKGESLGGRDQDDFVAAPYTSVMRQVSGTSKFGLVMVSARSIDAVMSAQEEIRALLRQRHRIGENQGDDFAMRSQEEIATTARQTSNTFALLLASVAAISLVVGGIGIMNIMLVSVAERTREVGLRLAVGARSGEILRQFLGESLMLALAGAVLGILLAGAACFSMTRIAHWPMRITGLSIAIAAASATLVGLLSGFFPARRASRFEPVRALRSE
jgi:macrolide transport system ATP-binding/permease protein